MRTPCASTRARCTRPGLTLLLRARVARWKFRWPGPDSNLARLPRAAATTNAGHSRRWRREETRTAEPLHHLQARRMGLARVSPVAPKSTSDQLASPIVLQR